MTLTVSDPLGLAAIQAGMVPAPLAEGAAEGSSRLDSRQQAAVIGDPVPIVFCRRDEAAGTGGVLISPAATEARFSNDSFNAVTASYHLVLSEGRIGSIQVRDVFQRSCRVGSFSQTYDRRAGTWAPGNFVTLQTGYDLPDCPFYCGNVGTYDGMSTLSFTNTIPDGFDFWNRQVHAFIRNGMQVLRLIDNTTGSSNNFADLVRWSLETCAKLPASMIDAAALLKAATFLAANGFACDCNITDSQNLGDLLAQWAPYFLLTETRVGGKRGLRPLLPANADGTINTGPLAPVFTFTEDHILPSSLEISYVPLSDRKPFAVKAIWRQQLTDDFGIIRTSEVRYEDEAASGPFEQHDLSPFCTRENHAVKAAAFIRARRRYVTHSVRFTSRPEAFSTLASEGSIVRLRLRRETSFTNLGFHDYLYEINRITKAQSGDVSIEATHFPVDSQRRSVIALDVAAAVGNGILLTSNRTGVSCDVNSSSDTTAPAETFTDAAAIDEPVQLPSDPGPGFTGDYGSWPETENPSDFLDQGYEDLAGASISGNPVEGNTLRAPEVCTGGTTLWYKTDGQGNRIIPLELLGSGQALQLAANGTIVGYGVGADITCPGDPVPKRVPYKGPIAGLDPAKAHQWTFTFTGDYQYGPPSCDVPTIPEVVGGDNFYGRLTTLPGEVIWHVFGNDLYVCGKQYYNGVFFFKGPASAYGSNSSAYITFPPQGFIYGIANITNGKMSVSVVPLS